MSAVAATLPEPLCKFYRHPIRWTTQHLQRLLYIGVGGYVGVLFVAALYYFLFELNGHMHTWWHEAVSNSDLRHTIRDVGEGLVGGMMIKFIVFNPYKKRYVKKVGKKLSILDKMEIKLGIPNIKDGKSFSAGRLGSLFLLVPLYAAPGFFAGYYVVQWIHGMHLHVTIPLSSNPSTNTFAQKLEATFTDGWPNKLVGYGSLFCFGLRPARGMFEDVQRYFIERRLASGKPTKWYHTAAYKARYNELRTSDTTPIKVSVWGGRFMKALVPVFVAGAIGGWYVLTYIATAAPTPPGH